MKQIQGKLILARVIEGLSYRESTVVYLPVICLLRVTIEQSSRNFSPDTAERMNDSPVVLQAM